MPLIIWNLNSGVSSDSDGTLNASIFNGSFLSGSDSTEISVDSDTNILSTGVDTTTSLGGYVIMDALPITNPVNLGQLWNDNGTVKVSAG